MQRVFGERGQPVVTPAVRRDRRAGPAAGRGVPAPGQLHPVHRARSPAGAWRRYYGRGRSRCSLRRRARAAPATLRRQAVVDDPLAEWPVRRAGASRSTGSGGRRDAGIAGPAGWCWPAVSTDCCVLSTALAAADAGVAVRSSRTPARGDLTRATSQALDIMAPVRAAGARWTSLAELTAGWTPPTDRRPRQEPVAGTRVGGRAVRVDRAAGALYGLAVGDALGHAHPVAAAARDRGPVRRRC